MKSDYINELDKSESPYLRQHAQNPVAWKTWKKGTFSIAREKNLPVLVSIGYSTCHWCHVMAHEVFEDRESAELMNNNLISVKVDREEHPEVDEMYMEVCRIFNGECGWPLNVFCNADGIPFYICSYVPRSKWKVLIVELSKLWNEKKDKVLEFTETMKTELNSSLAEPAPIPEIDSLVEGLYKQLNGLYDSQNPDFSSPDTPARFPFHSLFYFLLTRKELPSDIALKFQSILETIQDSGLYDRVGGGFHRYTVDRQWRVPHFEKMLYDNAQMITTYALAGSRFDRPDFISTAERTAEFLLRDMVWYKGSDFSGFMSAIDADDPRGEGSFYRVTREDLVEAIGIKQGLELAGLWDIEEADVPQNHVNPSAIPFPRGSKAFSRLSMNKKMKMRLDWEKVYNLLLSKRKKRPEPSRDNKIITSWNALAAMAFTILYANTGKRVWKKTAGRTLQMLTNRIKENCVERLPGIRGHLTDYGHLALAIFTGWEVFHEKAYLTAANKIVKIALNLFSGENGELYSSDPEEPLFTRFEEKTDQTMPSGAHSLLLTMVRLRSVGGDKGELPPIDPYIKRKAGILKQYTIAAPYLLAAILEYQTGPKTLSLPVLYKMELVSHLLKWAGTEIRIIPPDTLEHAFSYCEKDHCIVQPAYPEDIEKILHLHLLYQ
ncbi:MAG: thioredoxin domain-containing protein [Spirochaetales bacterium]|nr:thioredoxin domain-containing protein [Spirochaetales bacterium]